MNIRSPAVDAGSAGLSAYKRYLSQHHFGSLNGLRCICIMAVLWHHSPANTLIQQPLLTERGFVGVDFFFVLSGFLITTLLLREESRTGRISLSQFYYRRALRILPVYFLLVTAVSLYWIAFKNKTDLIGMVPYYYLFLAEFLKQDIPLLSITWSLSVEEQYYLIWPFILMILPAVFTFRLLMLASMILICLLAMLGIADVLNLPKIETKYAVFFLPGMAFTAILLGSLVAVILHNPKGYLIFYRLCAWRGAPLVLFTCLLIYLQISPTDLRGWPALGMDILMTLCVVSLVVRDDHIASRFMAIRPIARIGEISYGLYLYHLIGLHIANLLVSKAGFDGTSHVWAVTFIYPVISIIIAEISFRTYERYFLSMKNTSSPLKIHSIRS